MSLVHAPGNHGHDPAIPDLSLILACYNEESHLEQSVKEVLEVLDSTRWTYEIIFVEDCSRDRTKDIIVRLLEQYRDRNVRALFHEKNAGRGHAVRDGFRVARGRVVGFIDIDLEVHARYIPSCVLRIQNGADVAVAQREYKLHPGLFHRHILSRGYVCLEKWALGIPLNDTESGYKFFVREKVLPVLDEVEDGGWFWDTEIMARCYLKRYRIEEIPCLFIRRYDKKSTVRLVHDTCDYFAKLWRFRKTVKRLRAKEKT